MHKSQRTPLRWSVCLAAAIALFIRSGSACGSDANTPPPPQQSNAIVKIMPLGDSITESTTGLNSYRCDLWHLLVGHGYHVDFVGSNHGVAGGPPANADFDMDHEGHSGWRADEIVDHIEDWARTTSPDVVLLHIGTNDLWQGQSVGSTVTDIGNIIDVLRSVNPHIRILLAQLIPKATDGGIPALNAQLPALAAGKNQPESPIVLVDQYSGFDTATMTYDGTHPNTVGDSLMADRWFVKLAPMLDAFLASTARGNGQGMR